MSVLYAEPTPLPEPKPSLVALLDPRSRVMGAVLFALAVVAAHGLAALGAALTVAVVLAFLARLAPVPTLKRLLALDGFMVVVLAMLPFTVPGSAMFDLFGLPASSEGARQAVAILLKANAVTLAMLALLGSMEVVALGHALGRLGVPERFVALFLFTTRYIAVLHQEYSRLRLAMRARAFRLHSSVHSWRAMGWLVGMLLVMSLERSERIHAAMRCRGFTGRFHLCDDSRAGWLDWGFGAAQAASLALMLVLDVS
ncbi:MAG: cobalt ECF transporter T component CbiQ [Rhodospirillaceae bacterium]|nr:cobalt ECF transporter T component CbiQ [Rhodospirillales bacterium]